MSIPPKSAKDSVKIHTTMPKVVDDKLEAESQRRLVSKSFLIQEATIEKYLSDFTPSLWIYPHEFLLFDSAAHHIRTPLFEQALFYIKDQGIKILDLIVAPKVDDSMIEEVTRMLERNKIEILERQELKDLLTP